MKKIFTMIIICALMVSGMYAQTTNNTSNRIKASQQEIDLKDIPKGTWKLVIHTNKAKEENYQLMGEILIEEDYMIDKAIRDFHVIRTIPQGYRKMGRDYILNLVGKDSVIELSGFFVNLEGDRGDSEPDYSRIENRGLNDSLFRDSFREMVRIARILAKDGKIDYVSE